MERAIAIDAIADQELAAADQINTNVQSATPGSAPIIEAQADAWLVRAHAYSLLSELASVRGPLGLAVERDLWFQPGPIDEVLRRERPSSTAARKGEV